MPRKHRIYQSIFQLSNVNFQEVVNNPAYAFCDGMEQMHNTRHNCKKNDLNEK